MALRIPDPNETLFPPGPSAEVTRETGDLLVLTTSDGKYYSELIAEGDDASAAFRRLQERAIAGRGGK